MYLQTGDEHQWMTQLRRSMEAEATSRLTDTWNPGEGRRAKGRLMGHDDFGTSLRCRARAVASRVLDLLRSSMAGMSKWRRHTA